MLKVIIVEDEPTLRQGIATLIDWNQMGFEVSKDCANGIEAVNHLKNSRADLVVSDIKMPGMDGLELAEHIRCYYPDISIIFLTAYSEFEFAQKALKLGVNDYILKNDFVRSLPRAVQSLVEKKNRSVVQEKQGKPVSLGRLNLNTLVFKGILDGSIQDRKEISDLFSHYHISLDNYFVMVAEISAYDSSENRHKDHAAVASILNFFDSALKECSHFYTALSPNEVYIIVNCNNMQEGQGIRFLLKVCNDIMNTLTEYTEHEMHIGISACHQDLVEIKIASEEARIAAGCILDKSKIIAFKDIHMLPIGNPSLTMSKVRDRIFTALESSEHEAVNLCIYDMFHIYHECNVPIPKVRMDITVLIALCCEKFEDYCPDNTICERIKSDFTSDVMDMLTLKTIQNAILNMCAEMSSRMNSSCVKGINRLIIQSDNFIKENYALSIKLDDIAGLLHVNSSYLSRLYKKETGDSLVTAISKYRVEKAKEFLTSGKHLVSEVGAMVGIEDPAYFTKVFTKYTGISPKQFQSSHVYQSDRK